jgi:ATP-dependent DNA helicase RecG
LLENPITFNWLQLVIIDEQHRFGVSQRSLLRSKGENPHLLVMTATPIPRSLALTVYGDLDISTIDEMPIGRLPVETHVLLFSQRANAYQMIKTEIEAGHQAFIIYPLIESEDDELYKSAIDEYHRLQEKVFPQFKMGLMHGRSKQFEKDAIMKKFRDNVLNILVSTTVIEVGMDIPNATIVLIEGADRFGLAQLHQIRGRVGRGDIQSYCLLIPENETNFGNERLAVMSETNDGFKLAEFDLKQRGPGDFLGTRQSGYTGLRLASLSDSELITRARKVAKAIFKDDPNLSDPANRLLYKELQSFWPNLSGDIS